MFPLNAITGKAKVCISITAASTTPHVNVKGKGETSEDEMRFTAYQQDESQRMREENALIQIVLYRLSVGILNETLGDICNCIPSFLSLSFSVFSWLSQSLKYLEKLLRPKGQKKQHKEL